MKKFMMLCGATAMISAVALSSQAHAGGDNWHLVLGVSGGVVPEYIGSDDTEAVALPFINGRYDLAENHTLFASTAKGVGYKFKYNGFAAGAKVNYRAGRDESDNRTKLQGLGDLDDTATIGPFIGYRFGNGFKVSADYMTGLDDDNDGASSKFALSYMYKNSSPWNARSSVFAKYGDDEFMEDHFAVSAANVTANRQRSDADAGFYEAGLGGGIGYLYNQRHEFRVDGTVSALLGDAEDSSLVDEDTQYGAFLSYGYHF